MPAPEVPAPEPPAPEVPGPELPAVLGHIEPSALAARREAAVAGHRSDEVSARRALSHDAPEVKASGLAALARMGRASMVDLSRALADQSPVVRRRAADEVGRLKIADLAAVLGQVLLDSDPTVVEAAAHALGELGEKAGGEVGPLCATAAEHPDALCREAAVAALGCLGSEVALPTVLRACSDKPAIRRRAVTALAAFDSPEAELALQRATKDSDWQVRQAAEDLLRLTE